MSHQPSKFVILSGAKDLLFARGGEDAPGLTLAATPRALSGLIALAALILCGTANAQVSDARHGAPACRDCETHDAIGVGITEADVTDPLLTAMQQELAREKEKLVLPGMQRPYFMEYRLEDLHSWDASASYGALTGESERRQRIVRVEVRIGSYTSDSSSARGDGSLVLGPQDNDTAALKYALWSATDEAYKNALRAYATKQASLKRFQNPPTANDFAPIKPVNLIEPLHTLEIDRPDWKHRIVEASGLYIADAHVSSFAQDVQYSTASVSALVVNRYTVNTDGTALRHGYSGYTDNISVGGQAADGMQLGRSNGSTATTSTGLEDWATLKKRTLDNLRSYNDLRHAPVVDAEDYHGPVLFAGDAAADVVKALFVPNVEADRPDMGTTARTQGAYQSSLRSAVLPSFLSVVDDPTLHTFEGQSLVGAYNVDDEGVPVAPLTIVDHGKLVDYLIGREPVKDFPESNGHGRAAPAQPSHSKAGVIVVKPTEAISSEAMQAKLLALAKDQGRDVYIVETLADLAPRMLFRVSPDGKRTLVRGAVFDELDQRSLRSEVVAAGGKPWVAQSISPVPQTTIVPELLFADIAVKRATEQQGKVPYYAPPAAESNVASGAKR